MKQRSGPKRSSNIRANVPADTAINARRTLAAASASSGSNVRSIADSINDIAGRVLFGAGFDKRCIDPSELVEVLRYLEDCREEGRPLFPEVLITTDLEACFEGVHPYRFFLAGECEDRPGRIRRALKKCAAIAEAPWAIVIETRKQKVRYGFVSSELRADSGSVYDAVLDARKDAEQQEPPILFVRRFGKRAVWLKSPSLEQVVSLTLSDELLSTSSHVTAFAELVCKEVPDPIRTKTCRSVTNLIEEACRKGHGFIACAVSGKHATDSAAKEFPDGSWLQPPLQLAAPKSEDQNLAAALEGDSELRARLALARGMIEMDLMTVFSTRATIVGYNVHISSDNSTPITGGARSRAFASLAGKACVRGALMCSQDGLTSFRTF